METISALLALCEGNPSINGGSPHKGSVIRSFDVFMYAHEQTVQHTVEFRDAMTFE